MKTSIELTLDQARAVAADIGKSELSRRAGIPYASLHDLLRVGTGNRSLSNLAALERALRAYGDGEAA